MSTRSPIGPSEIGHFGTETRLGDGLLRRATHTRITLPCDAKAERSGSTEDQRGASRVLAAIPNYTQLMLTIPRFPSLVQELVDGGTETDLDLAAARWIAGRAELGFTTPFYVNLPPALECSALRTWKAATLGGEVWRTIFKEEQAERPESCLPASQSGASHVRAQDPVVREAARQRFVRQINVAFSDIIDSLIDPEVHAGSGKLLRGLFENFFARSGFPTGMILSEQEGWQRMKRPVQDGLADLT
ncbi:hypothetical protein CBOM_03009 [Ceraceosorus bombacis]|uniref:Uncharacterized protein n=1 Tax=Ceraceosorus bombacis TaxID=401625 RepID=A0A0P1BM77_9BASI|nr:hypothetical protein CBOM_03009 [Ceraceosorus bombacis]